MFRKESFGGNSSGESSEVGNDNKLTLERNQFNHENLGKRIVKGQKNPPECDGGVPLWVTNFVNRENPLPDWRGDHYLNALSPHMVGRGEASLVFKLPEGFRGYYQEVGIIDSPDQIIEIFPQIPQSGESINLSYPKGDLLTRYREVAGSIVGNQLEGKVLLASLTNEHVLGDAEGVGIKTLDQPNSDITNNKELFRKKGRPINGDSNEEGQYSIFPGAIVPEGTSREKVMEMLPEELKNSKYGVWVKLSGGSGGDTVKYVKELTQESFEGSIQHLRGEILKAYEMGDFGQSGEDAWPRENLSPSGSSLILESDVRNHVLDGEEDSVFLGSNFFVTYADGSHEIAGYYKQRTENGSFNGSQKYHHDAETQRLIDEQTSLVAEQSRAEGYYGPQGLDYFVFVNGETKKREVVLIERNGRPPVSAYAEMAGRKLGIGNWVNLNITFPKPISSLADFEEVTGEFMFKKGDEKGVFPLASRTIVGEDRVIASPHMKVLILGTPQEQEEQIAELQKRSARLGTHAIEIEEKVIYTV